MTPRDCSACNDYRPDDGPRPPGIRTRHLLYHVCPFAGNGTWQRNVLQLRKRIKLFNGRRVVAISTGPGLDPPGAVQAIFRGAVDEWLILPNSFGRRELATFLPLWNKLQTSDPSEATFYAHAKGVTRPVNPGTTVHAWTRIMYETCLDYWPVVRAALDTHPLAGTFKKVGRGFQGSQSAWHYSGTFYWVKNAELFRRDWKRVDGTWWGTESYPGLHFRPEEAGALLIEGPVQAVNLYSMGYLRGVVFPRYEAWKKEHAGERTDWGAKA